MAGKIKPGSAADKAMEKKMGMKPGSAADRAMEKRMPMKPMLAPPFKKKGR